LICSSFSFAFLCISVYEDRGICFVSICSLIEFNNLSCFLFEYVPHSLKFKSSFAFLIWFLPMFLQAVHNHTKHNWYCCYDNRSKRFETSLFLTGIFIDLRKIGCVNLPFIYIKGRLVKLYSNKNKQHYAKIIFNTFFILEFFFYRTAGKHLLP
jgi:hypothetical protein